MSDDNSGKPDKDSVREARLKLALRENLKRRKSQARGRAGITAVTPEDDARESAERPKHDELE
jgi:hypothetical protein